MKRILSAAVAALLAAGVAVVAPTTASAAVPSSVVTSTEFYKVAQGHSIDYVRKTFGNNGTVSYRYDTSGTKNDYLVVDFPTYYKNGTVTIDFRRRADNTWYLDSKYAFWAVEAANTTNKATEAEFAKVAQGNSIDYVRKTFGTNGTITSYYDAPGNAYDWVNVEWPTASQYGAVTIHFAKNSKGGWVLDTRAAYWGIDAAPASNVATEAEAKLVKPGNSLTYARNTFGSNGTITYQYDAPGVANDDLTVEWPTAAGSYDYVWVDFVKSAAGAWKVSSVTTSWS